jgi:predicted DNA-binding WGR domain protein
MAIVSSVRHHHITNDYNDGANYLKRFLYYAEMVSIGNVSAARTILDGLVTSERVKPKVENTFSVIASQIKNALEAKGYFVETQIGQSSFKCSLGVKRKGNDNEYSLGIMIDDETHYSNDDLVELYFQRPAILRSFGWELAYVFAKDWLEDSEKVLTSLIKQLEGKPDVKEPSTKKKIEDTINEESTQLVTRLISIEGEKFWEVSQNKEQLNIRFGKKESPGQVQVKTYENAAEAELAKNELIKEQISKGFKQI